MWLVVLYPVVILAGSFLGGVDDRALALVSCWVVHIV